MRSGHEKVSLRTRFLAPGRGRRRGGAGALVAGARWEPEPGSQEPAWEQEPVWEQGLG